MKKFIYSTLIICLLLTSLVGCSDVKRYVAYTVYPVGYLLNRIGGGRIETVSIQNNNLVQTASVTSDYKKLLEDSTYLFHIGNLEPYFELYDDEIAESGVTQVDLSSLNAIYKFCRYTLVYVDGKESYVESPYYNGEVFEEIDVTDLDLSLWIDPIGMLSMAKDVYETLASNYAEQSKYFKENYDKLESDLIALDAAYQSLSTKLKKENQTIKFVSMTPSFGNWQKAYGFQVYPVCLSKYGAIPSDEEYELIANRIKADGVQFIAYEPNMTDQMLQLFDRLEAELDLTRVNLYNISSLTPSQINENKDYMSLMYENLSVLENMATTIIDNPIDVAGN
ncbi:MAG: zinc ABC transporter substrate-binding protein [Parabacteroides sp.]|nr:zinc ABC transporter substrate-binding protein [Parabacteroides sp.]